MTEITNKPVDFVLTTIEFMKFTETLGRRGATSSNQIA
jgi:hypothetical protein